MRSCFPLGYFPSPGISSISRHIVHPSILDHLFSTSWGFLLETFPSLGGLSSYWGLIHMLRPGSALEIISTWCKPAMILRSLAYLLDLPPLGPCSSMCILSNFWDSVHEILPWSVNQAHVSVCFSSRGSYPPLIETPRLWAQLACPLQHCCCKRPCDLTLEDHRPGRTSGVYWRDFGSFIDCFCILKKGRRRQLEGGFGKGGGRENEVRGVPPELVEACSPAMSVKVSLVRRCERR